MANSESTNDKKKPVNKPKIWVVALTFICIIQGVFIYYLISSESKSFQNPKDLPKQLNDIFRKQKEDHFNQFDRFFDQDFFSSRKDPFEEMERLHERMRKGMNDEFHQLFENSWDGWLSSRFYSGLGGIDIEESETKQDYVYTLKVPNMKENRLNVTVGVDGISIEGEFSQTIERKDNKGNVVGRQERRQSISKKFPIPSDAIHDKAKIENRKDAIIILLPKKA